MSAPSSPPPNNRVTRIAPSPTGALHLGNARTFLINWAMARRAGWRVLLRIDDLAGPRVKRHAVQDAIDDLCWIGLDWDGEPIHQTNRLDSYRAAMRKLAHQAKTYPSELSRRETEAALTAPHAPAPGDAAGEVRFPPELRPPLIPRDFDETAERTSWRFVVESESVPFVDGFAGSQCGAPAETVGDFVVWTKDGEPAYQLATVVDDHEFGVTDVIRGDDLLDSAARQLLLFRALELKPEPSFLHLPLVVGPDGRRLAKRHGDTRISAYREAGVPAERVIALLARWSGITTEVDAMTATEFAEAFRLDTMPHSQTVFTDEDDAWLRAHS